MVVFPHHVREGLLGGDAPAAEECGPRWSVDFTDLVKGAWIEGRNHDVVPLALCLSRGQEDAYVVCRLALKGVVVGLAKPILDLDDDASAALG